ncbi:MAG: heavy-metal-associated domain-containing protein [Leptospiraceae bacterium]|nr:heavy-metal-associated domain-containing protein [Leptospiraceae bacterium]
MKSIRIEIEGMTCNHCVNAVQNALVSTPGVGATVVKLQEKCAEIEYDELQVTPSNKKKKIIEEGYQAKLAAH